MATQTADVTARLISDMMRDFGLSRDQAAAFAGNLGHETRGFQDLKQKGGGDGLGYGQWSGSRRTDFENYAKKAGLDLNSYEANYGFLKHELTSTPEKAVIGKLKGAGTLQDATQIVSDEYLRPGKPMMQSRQSYAGKAVSVAPTPPGNVGVASIGQFAPNIVDDSSKYGGLVSKANGKMDGVSGLVIHHTGGRGTVDSVANTLKERGYGVQYVMDRAGTVHRMTPEGSRVAHFKDGQGIGKGFTNSNTEGIEIIANDDNDLTPAQLQSFEKFAFWHSTTNKYDPAKAIFGHGEINDHKQATEGLTAKGAFLKDLPTMQADFKSAGLSFPAGLPQAEAVGTALDAIQRVTPASTPNLPSMRSAYADSMPELPRARPVATTAEPAVAPPAPRRSFTDEIIHNSTTPQDADPALQAALTRTADAKAGRVAPAYNAVTPDQKSALISSPKPTLQAALDRLAASRAAKLAEAPAPAQAAAPAPTAAPPAQAQTAPRVTAEGLNVRPVTTVKIDPSTGMPEASAPVVEKPAARVAGVSDIGYPYSFKAVQEKMHPRGTRSLDLAPEAPAKPAAKSATNALSFTPANDTGPALGKGYNALTSSQRNALSAVPEERLYPGALQPADKAFGGVDPVRVASIEDVVGNEVDANGKRVSVKAAAETPPPRRRPASLGIASTNALQPSPKVPSAPNRPVAPARVTVAAPTWLAKTMPKAAPIEVPVNGSAPSGPARVYSTAVERIYDRSSQSREGAEASSIYG